MTVRLKPTFIDLFAGCGGFSAGLTAAGWHGLFAVEHNPQAFATFSANFLGQGVDLFSWPEWMMPAGPMSIQSLVAKHKRLRRLQGHVDLIVGGPPCQGFSFAGRRNRDDHRNQLFRAYVKVVSLVQPKFVLLENVRGISVAHGTKKRRLTPGPGRPAVPYSQKIVDALSRLQYRVSEPKLLLASEFGVPQRRQRVFIVGVHPSLNLQPEELLGRLDGLREEFLAAKCLPSRPVTVDEALSDLLAAHGKGACLDGPSGFAQGRYGSSSGPYQRLMRNSHLAGQPADSHRFANHREATIERYQTIRERFRRGVQLHARERAEMSISKHVMVPLDGERPSHTLTTLPDDLIHYRENRILTVREYARLQSFCDTFVFKGPYTTGGNRRKNTCPRYTQIGNAVPPLLVEAFGQAIRQALEDCGYGFRAKPAQGQAVL